MYASYLRQSQRRRMFEGKRSSPPPTPSGCSPTPQGTAAAAAGADAVGTQTPSITIRTSTPVSPVPSTPPASLPRPLSTTTPIPVILEPSRVEGNGNTSPLSLSLQPPTLASHKGKLLPPVASASQMQTVFDSNGVFTITSGAGGTRPQSVISQQPLTILPLEEDTAGNKDSSSSSNNNTTHMYTRHTDSSSKYDRVTLSSSGSERSQRSVLHTADTDSQPRREGCCDRLCDNLSVLCCMLNCNHCHCDLCCLMCRICIAM